ncbi:MAG TPA: biotin transporter BioY [Syntrophales bacterium]|nr:biotin transporter BioY [Syntrophales bacterium]
MAGETLSTRGMIYASLFGALTAIGALISIPLQPVPIVLSNLFLNIASALLGGSLGALSQVIYIFLGGLGLPVFSGGKAGFGVLLGPTGGYLVGFVVGAFLIGKLVEKKKSPGFAWLAFSMTVGLAAIYAVGVLQLSVVAHLSLEKALTVGVLPFLPGDVLKIVAASMVTLKTRDKVRL